MECIPGIADLYKDVVPELKWSVKLIDTSENIVCCQDQELRCAHPYTKLLDRLYQGSLAALATPVFDFHCLQLIPKKIEMLSVAL